MAGLKFSSSIDKGFENDLNRMNKQMNSFASNVQTKGSDINNSFSQIGATIGGIASVAALARAGREVVNFSTNLQTSLTEVATISDEVTNNFDAYKQSLLELSKQSGSTAIELTDAFYDIVSAGYDGAKGLELLTAAEKASTAGFVEVGVAADGLTTVLNAWGKSAEEAGVVSDIFFKTVEKGKTTFPELGANINQVAPLAASLGVSFEEVSAAVATITKSGVPTSQAFTQIRAALVGMNESLGDGWAQTMTLQEGFQEIYKQAKGSATGVQELVGRVEGMNAILALSGQNAAVAAADLDAMTKALGATDVAAQKVTETAAVQGKILVNNLLAAFEPLGTSIVETFAKLASSLNEAFESGDIEKYTKILGTLIAAFAAWKISIFAVGQAQKINTALTNLNNAAQKASAITGKSVTAGNYLMAKSFKALRTAFASNPIGLLVTGLTLAIPLIVKFVNSQSELVKQTAKLNVEIKKEQTESNNLFEALKKTNPKSEERSVIVGKLIEKYPDLLKNYDLDVAGLNDIERAQDAVNKKIVETIALRSKEEQIQQAAEKFYDTQTKILSTYLNNLGTVADRGTLSAVFNKISADIEKGGADNVEVAKRISEELGIEITKGTYRTFQSNAGVQSVYEPSKYESLLSIINALNKANDDYLSKQKEIADFTSAFIAKTAEEVKVPKTPEEIASEEAEKARIAAEQAAALKATEDEKQRKKDLAALEIFNQEQINEITKNYGGRENLEKEFNQRMLQQRLDYLTKLKALTTDKLDKLKIEEERINLQSQLGAKENNEKEIQDLLKQYQSYAQRREALIKEANDKISKLQIVAGSEDAIKEIQKELEKNLGELDLSNIKATTGINKLFEDTKNKSLDEIRQLKEGAEQLLRSITSGEFQENIFGINQDEFDRLKAAPETVDLIRESIERLDQASQDTALSFEKIVSGFEKINKGSSNKQLSDGLSEIQDGAGGIIDAFKLVGSTLDSVFGADTSSKIEDLSNTIQSTFSGAQTGAQVGGKVGAIVGGALGFVSGIANIINRVKKENEQLKQNLEDTSKSITKIVEENARNLNVINEKFDNIFGGSNIGKGFIGVGEAIKEAEKQLQNYIGLEKTYAAPRSIEEAKNLLKDFDNQLSSINIKTKEGGWFKKDTYKGLLQLYPDLIDSQGKLNDEVAQGILSSNLLSDTQKATLQGALDASMAVEDAFSAMADYLSSIFGNLSNDITQAFQDMYEGGDDAMMNLEGSFSDMIENFTRDAIQLALVQPILDELDAITVALGESYSRGNISIEDLQTGIIDTLGDFYNSLSDIQPSILKAYEDADRLAAEAGFESAFGSNNSLDKASTSISESITEQTGTEIVGRMNAIMLSNQIISDNSSEMLTYAIQNLVTLNKIRENTDYLPQIAKYTKQTADKL